MDRLELDLCFSGDEISESFVDCVKSGSFSCCVSDLTLLQIEEPVYVINHRNRKAKDFKDVMRGEINRQTKKISTVALVYYFNNVEYLNLRSNRIGVDGASMMGSFTLKKLQVLDLSGSHEAPNIGKEGFLQLTSNMDWSNFPNLTRLSLAQNRLDAESMISLIACETFPRLKALDLFGNKLDNDAIEWLVASERVLSNLTELNIGYNEYFEEATHFIANCPFLKNLVILNMAGKVSYRHGAKSIGDNGVNTLFNSDYLENLTSINLSNNNVSDEGAKNIYKSNKLKNLTKINLNSHLSTFEEFERTLFKRE
ncbi:predicted protein [Naegleria gruberi]|uniref:Predicted protein n=1 Tax=Naegleria gruberi TaxID=5762 RepID=D2VBH2_NAEGR|nr:uncharacterized protein NAEGRDRAFT_66216 [Naegleria gruberi]EFC45798.1 predicted protein [Naegleria gruberi]|eukprot:XP_002678542.1 predicted protein [Naegleria gruberi strain NEG-M]